ncbi:MAG: FolB domain-containing protein [Epsilonproteobacteria bacterium]|nr:FolB domain-containing protein [Campylobacterota bacterium]
MNVYKVIIEQLKLKVILGVLNSERTNPQDVIVNAWIEYNLDEHFLDYTQAVEAIKNLLKYKEYDTIENALNDICKALKIDFPEIISIKLQIYKPEVFKNALVGVEIYKEYK